MDNLVDFKQIYRDILNRHHNDQFPKGDDASITITDVGDGNLNHVEIIKDSHGKAVVMKQAPPYIKCIGPSHSLSVARNKIEYESYMKFSEVCPGSTPTAFVYDEKHNAVLMSYLDGYTVQKKQLISGKVDKVAAQKLARNIAQIHAATHRSNLTPEKFEKLKETFKNKELCDLTQNFVFTYPFIKGQETNVVKDKVLEAAEKRVYENQDLLAKIATFKARFFIEECLVHGDLHTGSVMVKDGDAKIIDNEFSYIGPMAMDIGHLVAHYMITYHQHMLTEEDNDAHRRVSYKMLDIINLTLSSYLDELQKRLPSYSDQFKADFMSDVAGFAGCELMRRVLGIAHVEDINHSAGMELAVLDSGIRLVQGHGRIDDIGRLTMIGLQLC